MLGRQRLERGEGNHVPDARTVREEHDQTVDADTLKGLREGEGGRGMRRMGDEGVVVDTVAGTNQRNMRKAGDGLDADTLIQ